MKTGIISILGAILLVLTPSLPASASESGTITITMTGVETVISISLDPASWPLGDVTEDAEYKTDPEATWCTITNDGNVNVDLGLKGEHAVFSTLLWFLSEDGTNDGAGSYPEYALWYHIAMDTEGSYTSITLNNTPMKKGGESITLDAAAQKQFGLKLLTPVSFPAEYFDKEMTTHITISAVKA
jgi:hypothetical protein